MNYYYRSKNSDIYYKSKNIVWSVYFPYPMIHALYQKNELDDYMIKNDDYILCPKYSDSPYDVQLGITGSLHQNESLSFGLNRELAEELGLEINEEKVDDYFVCKSNLKEDINSIKYNKYKYKYKYKKYDTQIIYTKNGIAKEIITLPNKEMSVFNINILNCNYVPPKRHNKDCSGKNDSTRQIGCIIYGKKNNILNFLKKEIIYHYLDTDKINYLVAVPASKARIEYSYSEYNFN